MQHINSIKYLICFLLYYSPRYTCRWKRRPRQEITDYVAAINEKITPPTDGI
jgi:hypothetical protein